MKYLSTRGGVKGLSFADVLVSSYATDGGMYLPETIPKVSLDVLRAWADLSYEALCAEILYLYVGEEIELEALQRMTKAAFASFNTEKANPNDPPLPLHQFGDLYLLDCSLGPTFAFKDIGQQIVAQLLNHVLERQGKRALILLDTSGDTGPAAIDAVKQCTSVDIICLYPHQRVSSVQELQMVTVLNNNVHVYRTEGTSDEQASVLKEIFSDQMFSQKHNLCSINSINWGRIMCQSTYYIWAYLQLWGKMLECERREVNFVIPTGAFGNALGAFIARQMGIPIRKILCATNANDIVYRTLSSGDMSMGTNVQTISPAMDIQFAYNLERCIYYLSGENSSIVRDVMASVDRQFAYESDATGAQLDTKTLASIQEVFGAIAVSDEDTKTTIRWFQQEHNFTLCPHSAIGIHAARSTFSSLITQDIPMVCVLTAHPAKFEETIRQVLGKDPVFPSYITALRSKPHRFTWLRQSSIAADTTPTTTDTTTSTTIFGMKNNNDDHNDKNNVITWRQQWIDTIKRKIQDITTTHQQQSMSSSLVGVHQTDFHSGTGNALQACVATLLRRSLDSVPNFITLSCGYDEGIKEFVLPHYHVCKIMLTDLKNHESSDNKQLLDMIPINQLVILRGKSPRGTHGHVVIAQYTNDINNMFINIHDPHPDATFLDDIEPPVWCMYFKTNQTTFHS